MLLPVPSNALLRPLLFSHAKLIINLLTAKFSTIFLSPLFRPYIFYKKQRERSLCKPGSVLHPWSVCHLSTPYVTVAGSIVLPSDVAQSRQASSLNNTGLLELSTSAVYKQSITTLPRKPLPHVLTLTMPRMPLNITELSAVFFFYTMPPLRMPSR